MWILQVRIWTSSYSLVNEYLDKSWGLFQDLNYGQFLILIWVILKSASSRIVIGLRNWVLRPHRSVLMLTALLDGIKVGEVRRSGNNVDLTLMGKDETIRRIEDFDNLQVNTPLGKTADLKSMAKINLVAGPTQINHVERLRSITIQVIPPETIPLEQAMDIIREEVIEPLKNSGELKRPYGIGISGTADDLTRTREALQWNLLLAVIITFLLMASLFESFLYPFVIMFSVPLAAAGGFLGLYLVDHFITHQAMDILTMLGFVILIGIVVNNAILIVHQSLNFMRYQGLPPREAIRESVRTRIRPIFMSTLTSVMGMIPLVLFPGAGSELYRGLGGVVIGGLIVSTIFTLILVPSLFSSRFRYPRGYRKKKDLVMESLM